MEFKNQEFNSSKLISYLNGLSSANRDAGVRELASVSDLKRADLLNIYKYVSIFGMSELFFDVFATHPLLVEIKSNIKPLEIGSVLILDPGQNNNGGHHENYNLFYAEKAKSENKKCQIWGNCLSEASAKLTELAEINSSLLTKVYGDRKDDFSISIRKNINQAFSDELEFFFGDVFPSEIIFHTACDYTLAGFLVWLLSLDDWRNIKVSICLMKIRRSQNQQLDNDVRHFIQEQLTLIQNEKSKNITVYSQSRTNIEFVGKEYSDLIELQTLPYLSNVNILKSVAKPDVKKSFTIGFLGQTREEKGILELIDFLHENVIPEYILFILQIDKDALYRISPMHLDKVKYLTEIKSNIQIIDGYLDLAEYHSIYLSLDAVILPYRQQYVGRGSGILDEAVHFKKIVFCHENIQGIISEALKQEINFFEFENLFQNVNNILRSKTKVSRLIIKEDQYIKISVKLGLKGKMTIVSFSGFGNQEKNEPSENFANPKYTNGNQIFIIDKQRSWGNNFDFENISNCLKPYLSKNVMTIGSSMGGFLAILASKYIRTEVCVIFNPQFSVHPDIIPGGSYYTEWVNKIKKWKYPSLSNSFNAHTRYYVLTSDSEQEKKHYVNFPKQFNISLYIFKGWEHSVAEHLKQKGLLLPTIQQCSTRGKLEFK